MKSFQVVLEISVVYAIPTSAQKNGPTQCAGVSILNPEIGGKEKKTSLLRPIQRAVRGGGVKSVSSGNASLLEALSD